MAKYAGRDGVVYLAATGTGTATTVLGLTEWSMDMARDTIEVTEFGDSNKTYVTGLKDLTGDFAGFWNDAETKLFSGADSADGVKMYLYPTRSAPTKYACGVAWLDMSIDTGVNDAVAISGSFSAAGTWLIQL
jgi:hypothetical protein